MTLARASEPATTTDTTQAPSADQVETEAPDAEEAAPDAEEAAPDAEEAAPDAEEAAPEVIGPAERLEEGWERVRRGDYEGGNIMADQVLTTGQSEYEEEGRYLKAFSLEWGGRLEEALAVYEESLSRWPEGRYHRDCLFRKTETIGKLGRYDEALKLLKVNFGSEKDLSEEDQLKIDLLKGIWLVEQGKEKPGIRAISKSLGQSSPDQVTWYQGQASSVLVRAAVSQLRNLPLKGGQGKMRKQLATQAVLVSGAESLLKRTIDLQEPAWIIDQLHSIGTAYQILGDHLRAAPVGALDGIQLAAYEQELRGQVETVYIKALKYYDLGLEHAARVQWSGSAVDDLHNAREALTAKIEAL